MADPITRMTGAPSASRWPGRISGAKRRLRLAIIAALLPPALLACAEALAARCLYVASYHREYDWNFGVEKGLDAVLGNKCELRKFYMDAQRNDAPAHAMQKSREARALIEQYKPDVVIACDDPASKYLVMPYYKNAAIPFVFCGINWTVEPYGYPYSNATGMVEVSPVKPLLDRAVAITHNQIRNAMFIAADVMTQHKEFEPVSRIFAKKGIRLTPVYVKTFGEWKTAYIKAQQADLVYLSNAAGIADWDEEQATRHAYEHARKFSVTTYQHMMPYAMLGMVKIPEEHGEWAAKVALRILAGSKPQSIPIVANQRWNIYTNSKLLDKAKIKLPALLLHKAIER
ncbi:MAG: ABC transporter substrate binding protein [Pseudomonadota bacterium]